MMTWKNVPICDECYVDEGGDLDEVVRVIFVELEPCYRCSGPSNIFVRRDIHPAWAVHEVEASCPRCGAANDSATTNKDHAAPRPGDVTICIECGCIAIFVEGGGTREATAEEHAEALTNNDVVMLAAAIMAVHEDE